MITKEQIVEILVNNAEFGNEVTQDRFETIADEVRKEISKQSIFYYEKEGVWCKFNINDSRPFFTISLTPDFSGYLLDEDFSWKTIGEAAADLRRIVEQENQKPEQA